MRDVVAMAIKKASRRISFYACVARVEPVFPLRPGFDYGVMQIQALLRRGESAGPATYKSNRPESIQRLPRFPFAARAKPKAHLVIAKKVSKSLCALEAIGRIGKASKIDPDAGRCDQHADRRQKRRRADDRNR